MIKAVKKFLDRKSLDENHLLDLEKIILVAQSQKMYDSFRKALVEVFFKKIED